MSNSPQTRFSSVGSRNTVEPLEPYRARLPATFVLNTSRNRSTFSTVVVARIMTVLLTSGLLRILLLADRFGWRRAHSPDEGRPPHAWPGRRCGVTMRH